MPTDLEVVNAHALASAETLENRAASIKALADQTGTIFTVGIPPEEVERIAQTIRSYVSISASLTRALASESARAAAAEAACASGTELLAVLKTSTLPELIAFWEKQRETA